MKFYRDFYRDVYIIFLFQFLGDFGPEWARNGPEYAGIGRGWSQTPPGPFWTTFWKKHFFQKNTQHQENVQTSQSRFFEKSVSPHKRQIPVGFPYQPRARINVSRQKDAKSGVSMVEQILYVYLFYVSSRPRPISEKWVFKPFVAGGH